MTELRFMRSDDGFLGVKDVRPENALAVIIPFGMERSVSYGLGTRRGPRAILAASHQIEFFDEVFWCDAHETYGIATLEEPKIDIEIEGALDQIEARVEASVSEGKFPLTLGGEHALTIGAIKPLARKYDDIVVLQIDAHADLRESYQDNPFSHACAMRRVLDHPHISVVSLGVRSISSEEVPFLEANKERVEIFWAKDKKQWDYDGLAQLLQGKNIYISFDVDGFDASLMPATGTPEPGGLFFDEAEHILSIAAQAGHIIGADIVELAPHEALTACDFTVAKLAYKILNYTFLQPR